MQRNFSDLECSAVKRVTRRERFLDEMDAVMPWGEFQKKRPSSNCPICPANGRSTFFMEDN